MSLEEVILRRLDLILQGNILIQDCTKRSGFDRYNIHRQFSALAHSHSPQPLAISLLVPSHTLPPKHHNLHPLPLRKKRLVRRNLRRRILLLEPLNIHQASLFVPKHQFRNRIKQKVLLRSVQDLG